MKGKRTIRRTVRGSLCAYIGGRFWANLGEAFDPAAERRAAEWLDEGKDTGALPRGSMEDKMQQFIPGIVPGQQRFYHVAASGAVVRHWLVPGTCGPRSHGPAADHPLGVGPEPGWYDGEGNKLARDPCGVAP